MSLSDESAERTEIQVGRFGSGLRQYGEMTGEVRIQRGTQVMLS